MKHLGGGGGEGGSRSVVLRLEIFVDGIEKMGKHGLNAISSVWAHFEERELFTVTPIACLIELDSALRRITVLRERQRNPKATQ